MLLKTAAPNNNGAPSPDEQGNVRRDAFSAKAGGVNQRVWMLVNKGQVWRDLLKQPTMRAVVGHVLGVASYGANIAKPGGIAMNLHTDPVVDAGAGPSPSQSRARRLTDARALQPR